MQQGDYRITECRGRYHIEIYWYTQRRLLWFRFRTWDWFLVNPWGAAWENDTTPQALPEVFDNYNAALNRVKSFYGNKTMVHHYIPRP